MVSFCQQTIRPIISLGVAERNLLFYFIFSFFNNFTKFLLFKPDLLKQQGHYYDMNTVAYSPNGQLIATGSDDGKLKIWNSRTGFCFVTFTEHQAPITNAIFSTKGYF